MIRYLNLFTNLYAFWVFAVCILAFFYPALFDWFSGVWIKTALSIIMLGMGLTLHVRDFKRIVQKPLAVGVGVASQYAIMPLIAWGIAVALQLRPEFAVGLILVGCCPGGTASNLVAFLARANVALSVVLTMVSTFLATILTPILTEIYAGSYVPVDGWGIFLSTLQVVLLPVLAGLFINSKFPQVSAKVNAVGPAVAVLAIVMIGGSIVGQNVELIRAHWQILAVAGCLLHVFGFLFGYWAVRLLRQSPIFARTVSIEVGMQNSGLAMVLANSHFAAGTASPAVFSAVFHTLVGSLCAAYWRLRPAAPESSDSGRDENEAQTSGGV